MGKVQNIFIFKKKHFFAINLYQSGKQSFISLINPCQLNKHTCVFCFNMSLLTRHIPLYVTKQPDALIFDELRAATNGRALNRSWQLDQIHSQELGVES